ncbi:MAG: 16S rRNA (guanine(966)-N(2))-methyltransferase RsmD [Candidatus Hydrogenedentota bacterium]
MRIIAGRARGLRLEPPGDLPVRPSLDRVREAVFSALTGRLAGARFLDLFAGTGANGLEALSRGAAAATLVDANPRVCALIRRNLAKTRLHVDARVLLLDLPADLGRAADPAGAYDLVYADPPHAFTQYEALLEELDAHALVAPDGWVVLEHPQQAEVPEVVGRWTRNRTRRYGRSGVTVFA